jgi:hypothetical protein
MMEKTDQPNPHAPVFHRARLDADLVYWGVEQVTALGPRDIEVPAECDLKPGHYRWNPDAKPEPCFDPLKRDQRRDTPEQPLTERALYELLLAMQQAGQPVPPYCQQWACWYEQTMDAKGIAKLDAHPFEAALKGGA